MIIEASGNQSNRFSGSGYLPNYELFDDWFRTRCVSSKSDISCAELFADWAKHADRPGSKKAFGLRIHSIGYQSKAVRVPNGIVRCYIGLGLAGGVKNEG